MTVTSSYNRKITLRIEINRLLFEEYHGLFDISYTAILNIDSSETNKLK